MKPKNKTPKPKQEKVIRQFFDGDENRLIIESTDKRMTVFIKLVSESKKRKLGGLTKSTRTFFVKRERDKHLLLKANAYGFNYQFLSDAKQVQWVTLADEYADYKIPREYILQNGQFLWFKQTGFERQIFITLDQIAQFEIKPTENRRP